MSSTCPQLYHVFPSYLASLFLCRIDQRVNGDVKEVFVFIKNVINFDPGHVVRLDVQGT